MDENGDDVICLEIFFLRGAKFVSTERYIRKTQFSSITRLELRCVECSDGNIKYISILLFRCIVFSSFPLFQYFTRQKSVVPTVKTLYLKYF